MIDIDIGDKDFDNFMVSKMFISKTFLKEINNYIVIYIVIVIIKKVISWYKILVIWPTPTSTCKTIPVLFLGGGGGHQPVLGTPNHSIFCVSPSFNTPDSTYQLISRVYKTWNEPMRENVRWLRVPRTGLRTTDLVHLLLISLTPKQLKLINNPLCYLTDQINTPGV